MLITFILKALPLVVYATPTSELKFSGTERQVYLIQENGSTICIHGRTVSKQTLDSFIKKGIPFPYTKMEKWKPLFKTIVLSKEKLIDALKKQAEWAKLFSERESVQLIGFSSSPTVCLFTLSEAEKAFEARHGSCSLLAFKKREQHWEWDVSAKFAQRTPANMLPPEVQKTMLENLSKLANEPQDSSTCPQPRYP